MQLRPKSQVNYRQLAGLNMTEARETKPSSIKVSLILKDWTVAMEEELRALSLNKTWALVLPP